VSSLSAIEAPCGLSSRRLLFFHLSCCSVLPFHACIPHIRIRIRTRGRLSRLWSRFTRVPGYGLTTANAMSEKALDGKQMDLNTSLLMALHIRMIRSPGTSHCPSSHSRPLGVVPPLLARVVHSHSSSRTCAPTAEPSLQLSQNPVASGACQVCHT
jgi:hypothetical protein